MRILIVDADLAGRCALQRLLAGRGAIDTAVTARDAVRLFAASLDLGQPYDLVCLDAALPDMGAPAVIRALRAREGGRRVPGCVAARVLVTVGTAPEDTSGPGGAGVVCVSKPADRRGLEQALRAIGLESPETAGAR